MSNRPVGTGSHPRSRRVRRVTAAALTLAFATALWASPAWAHTRLEATEPVADETTDEPFDAVVLIFSQRVQSEFAEVHVTDPAGTRLDDGDLVMEGPRVEQPLTDLEELGEYTVEWRVVALDGHALEGTFVFDYDGPLPADEVEEPAPEPVPEEPVEEPDPIEPDEPTEPEDPEPVEEEGHDEDEAIAAPAGDAGAGGVPAPLWVAALVVALTAGAAIYAMRTVRQWGPAAAPEMS